MLPSNGRWTLSTGVTLLLTLTDQPQPAPQAIEIIALCGTDRVSTGGTLVDARGRLQQRPPHIAPPGNDPFSVFLRGEGSPASQSQIQVTRSRHAALVNNGVVTELAGGCVVCLAKPLFNAGEAATDTIQLTLDLELEAVGNAGGRHL